MSELSPWFRQRPVSIYHYTTVSGLQGILESNRLWASAAYYLNDSSEIEYGCQIVRETLAGWRNTNENNPSFAADALRHLDQLFSSPLSRISRTTTIYVSCFCENDNLLSQWRAYGQVGGYSLGFEIERFRVSLSTPNDSWDLKLSKVVYDKYLQRANINSVLKLTLSAISDAVIGSLTNLRREALLWETALYISESLLDEIVTFKNPAFREEKEWRLIARPRIIDAPEITSQEGGSGVKFRASRGALVPYLELAPLSDRLPLKSVRFGPSLEASRAEHSIRMLLESRGFDGVDIAGSEIPVIL